MKIIPISVRICIKNREELSTYFVCYHHLRRIIYTTNTIESYNRQLRKVTKNRSVFPTVKSLEKLLYLATRNIEEKWGSKVHNWGQILGQFDSFFQKKGRKIWIFKLVYTTTKFGLVSNLFYTLIMGLCREKHRKIKICN